MESGKITQFLKLKPSPAPTLLESSLCRVLPPNEIQLVTPPNKRRPFRFQQIFTPDESPTLLNKEVALPLVRQVLQGSNASAIVIGAPGSGKTTALFGDDGIVDSSLTQLFSKITHLKEACSFVVMVSFVQLFKDKVRDLGLAYSKRNEYDPEQIKTTFEQQNLEVKDSNSKSYVENVELIQVSEPQQVVSIIQEGLRNLCHSGAHTVLSISVSQKPFNSKITKSSRLIFADISGDDFKKLQQDEAAHLDINALKLVVNKANLVYHNVPFVTVPFRQNKLTHILQSAFAGTAQIHVLSMIDIGAEHYEDTFAILKYSKSLLEIDKMLKRKITATPDLSETFDHIGRLEEEIEDLRGAFKKVQTYHEERLKYLSKLIGIDQDLETLLAAQKGSSGEAVAKRYREAKSTVSTLRMRGRQLKQKLFTNKNILEEIKLVNRNNQQKNEREIQELENQIKTTRDELDDIRERQEETAVENAIMTTENLEKLLLHSHLVLEEKSSHIHNLCNQMKVRATKAKNLAQTWEEGKNQTTDKFKREMSRKESNFRESAFNLEEQYKYIMEQRDASIRNLSYSITQKQSNLNEKSIKTKQECLELLQLAEKHEKIISNIRNGAYNNGIIPIIISAKELNTLSLDRFSLISAQKKTGRIVTVAKPAKSLPSRPMTRSVVSLASREYQIDLDECLKPQVKYGMEKKACQRLQSAIKDQLEQMQVLKARNQEMDSMHAKYEVILNEKVVWQKQYNEVVKRRLSRSTNSNSDSRLTMGRLLQRDIVTKAPCDYADLKHNRIPIVPKSQRRLIGTARPGDRMIPNGRLSQEVLRNMMKTHA